jgi:hypothetical protein
MDTHSFPDFALVMVAWVEGNTSAAGYLLDLGINRAQTDTKGL